MRSEESRKPGWKKRTQYRHSPLWETSEPRLAKTQHFFACHHKNLRSRSDSDDGMSEPLGSPWEVPTDHATVPRIPPPAVAPHKCEMDQARAQGLGRRGGIVCRGGLNLSTCSRQARPSPAKACSAVNQRPGITRNEQYKRDVGVPRRQSRGEAGCRRAGQGTAPRSSARRQRRRIIYYFQRLPARFPMRAAPAIQRSRPRPPHPPVETSGTAAGS